MTAVRPLEQMPDGPPSYDSLEGIPHDPSEDTSLPARVARAAGDAFHHEVPAGPSPPYVEPHGAISNDPPPYPHPVPEGAIPQPEDQQNPLDQFPLGAKICAVVLFVLLLPLLLLIAIPFFIGQVIYAINHSEHHI